MSETCPWCQAPIHRHETGEKVRWACGSFKHGEDPVRSNDCQLDAATLQIARLTAERDEARKQRDAMENMLGDPCPLCEEKEHECDEAREAAFHFYACYVQTSKLGPRCFETYLRRWPWLDEITERPEE